MKVLAAIAFLFAAACSSWAQNPVNGHQYDRSPVSATGATTYIDVSESGNSGFNLVAPEFTVSVTLGTGSNTACTWQVEGSDDRSNWFALQTSPSSCTAPAKVIIKDQIARYVHVYVLTYSGTAPLSFHYTAVNR